MLMTVSLDGAFGRSCTSAIHSLHCK